MPMMMEDDLDDLFGDRQLGEITTLPNLSSNPEGLVQRLDDLRISGCSQSILSIARKIAWSNTGCIATIANGGDTVTLRNLYCDPASGLWNLSDGDEAKEVALVHAGQTLKHLSWNDPGTDLAVIDTLGHISVFSLLTSINRCSVTKRCVLGVENNFSVPVGSTWLSQDRPLLLHGPTVKDSAGQWAFTGSRQKQAGPHNPHVVGEQSSRNRAALVVVTKSGSIRLFYQGPDGGRWLEFESELESISSAAGLLTHAAMCGQPDQSIVVATYSVSQRIRTYRVCVDWSRQCFLVDHLTTIVDCSPDNDALDGTGLSSSLPYSEPQLYHLEILSPAPDLRKKNNTLPLLLLAFFCSASDRNEHPTVAINHSTFIVRWELSSIKPILHPSFSQLASKKPNGTHTSDLQPDITFRRLQDVRESKVMVAVRELHLATTLVFCFSDGSVEFRSRSTLDLLPHDETDRVSSMAQVGLEFLPGDPFLHAALSPSACALVTLDDKCTARLKIMQMPHGYADSILETADPEAVAAACVMQFNMAYIGYGNHHDDLSATMQSFQKQYLKDRPQEANGFVEAFLSDMYRITQLNVDYSGDIKTELYLKNALHQKALSLQLSLGYQGEQQHRALSFKVSFAILQLRWAALTLVMGLKSNSSSPEAEFNRTEMVRSFFGIISWTLSLMNYIMDELLTLVTEIEENGPLSYDLLEAKIQARNTPVLALLFVSQSRLLLKYTFRLFRSINVEAMQNRSQNPTWRELVGIFTASPVPTRLFEKVITDVETSVRSIYESHQFPDTERKEIEKKMLISGSVPPQLWPAVESLLTKTLTSVSEGINRAGLFFHDISWIGLSDDKASDQWRKEHRLDIVRKIEMPRRAKVRRCTRCCCVMEDSAPVKGTTGWLVNMWRSCVCGNWWMDVDDEGGGRTGGNGMR
ncbi:MAG: hypothetical protein Q9172_004478 [Xanthocarpia lactea]